MFAQGMLLAALLLAACDGDPSALARQGNPAQAEDAAVPADTSVPAVDASGLPIGSNDGAVSPDAADASRGTPNVVPYPACGGVAGLRCHDGELCSYEVKPDGLGCGWEDSLGTCTAKAKTCSASETVCGCDGISYASRCAAHAAGSSVKSVGACKADRETSCDERDVLCKKVRPSCPDGQVPAVVDGCWGDCSPIAGCICHAADECPERERYVCHMNAQHCGPYVN